MYSYQASPSKKYTSIILTLIVHMLICLAFLYEYHKDFNIFSEPLTQEQIIKKLEQEKEERERAELIQRGGAPIIFQQMPEYKEENINDMIYNPVHPQDDAETPSLPPQLQNIQAEKHETPPETSLAKTEEIKQPEKLQQQPQSQKTEQQQEKPPQQTTPKLPNMQTMAFNTQTQKTTARRSNIQPGDSNKNASPHAKQVTFADILEGFSQMLKNGNNDWMSQTGKKDKAPDYQDLKTMSYMQKLSHQLRTAWNMGIDNGVQKLFKRGMHNFKFALSIAKNGDILDLQIAQSTGITEIDSLLLQMIRTSSPFPPVPDHLKMQVFNMLYELMWT